MLNGVIVGGGIAGMATALFANKFGINLPIYESLDRQFLNKCGLIWLAPNGLRLLKKLGLIEKVDHFGVLQKKMLYSTHKLKTKLSLDCHALTKVNGFPIIAIKRHDLYDVMRAELESRCVNIQFNKILHQIYDDENSINISFKGSDNQLQSDFLIGADGMHSCVREVIFAKKSIYQGIAAWYGSSLCKIADRYVGKTIEVWGNNGTRFLLTSLDGEIMSWVALERDENFSMNTPSNIIARLRNKFCQYHSDISETLEAAIADSVFRVNFEVVDHLQAFHMDRVCLIGDAAHGMPPNMGQGASLALEDAYILSKMMYVYKENLHTAFKLYNLYRQKRVRMMVRMATLMNTLFQPRSKVGSYLRNGLATVMPTMLLQKKWKNIIILQLMHSAQGKITLELLSFIQPFFISL